MLMGEMLQQFWGLFLVFFFLQTYLVSFPSIHTYMYNMYVIICRQIGYIVLCTELNLCSCLLTCISGSWSHMHTFISH